MIQLDQQSYVAANERKRGLGTRDGAKLSILLLCDDKRGHANTVLDHIGALTQYSGHEVRVFNPVGMAKSRYLDLSEFDAVVMHYSLVIIADRYLSQEFREQIRRFNGLKVQFLQDEYRWVDEITAMMRYLGIQVLFTLMPEAETEKLYGTRLPAVEKVRTLAGYVPERLIGCKTLALESRPIDIGYRGRTLPYWLGSLSQEKMWIAQGVLARAEKYQLRCDIGWSEKDRIYGRKWNRFVGSCKATLGTESGASIADFDGSIERKTKAYLAEHPGADFHEVHREVLRPYEGNVRVTAVSPRIFEAAALRTAMVLFPGEYSGTVHPWVHYIPLAKDFSNLGEVAERLRDTRFLQFITDNAYRDLVVSGRYSQRAFAQQFDQLISAYGRPIASRRKVCYHVSCVERRCREAAGTLQDCAQPVLRVVHDLIKGAIALVVMGKRKAGVEILRSYLTDRAFRQAAPFNKLLRDVLKLAVVGQTREAAPIGQARYTVSVRFDPETGRLLFESVPLNGRQATTPGVPMFRGSQPLQELCWSNNRTTGEATRVRTMVWNHSALGGNVQYALTSWIGLSVGLGNYDIHSFDGFVQVFRYAPESAWDFLRTVTNVKENGGLTDSSALVNGG